ncbi:MAG UNVERIFIED_CONTAM: Grx4 family monothiol glutaredoxin [Rickettsiaceae bacterium]|jgi:monothiol glutaredoxin
MANMHEFIDNLVKENDVVLFMKGTKDFPQCGFSSLVVQILQKMEVQFLDINVLENMDLRQGIKDYTDWPTIPQLYIKGEFIGGSDIVKELYDNGQLKDLLSFL